MFCVIPRIWHTSLVNLDVNRGSLLLMILQGSPKHQNTWVTKRAAIPSAVMASLHGMNKVAVTDAPFRIYFVVIIRYD